MALISQLLAPLQVGHKNDTETKAHSFVNQSENEYGRQSFRGVGGDLV
jgi:hypothetical protein